MLSGRRLSPGSRPENPSGIARSLFLEDGEAHCASLLAYDEPELLEGDLPFGGPAGQPCG